MGSGHLCAVRDLSKLESGPEFKFQIYPGNWNSDAMFYYAPISILLRYSRSRTKQARSVQERRFKSKDVRSTGRIAAISGPYCVIDF